MPYEFVVCFFFWGGCFFFQYFYSEKKNVFDVLFIKITMGPSFSLPGVNISILEYLRHN